MECNSCEYGMVSTGGCNDKCLVCGKHHCSYVEFTCGEEVSQ